jgi:hypothetical protein
MDTYGKYYDIKVAAYSKSIGNLNVNWNLDALLDFRGRYTGISTSNSNFALYVRGIKAFKPDLIISDMEMYSSYIGLDLGIPVWQVSPMLLYYAIEDKNNLYKYYSGLFSKTPEQKQYTNYVLGNSDKKLVLSHLGDLPTAPQLEPGYEWVRPNYCVSEGSCIHTTSVAINLADAYFSGRSSTLDVDYSDPESIITSQFNYNHGLSVKHERDAQLFDINISPDIKFLSQYLAEVDI